MYSQGQRIASASTELLAIIPLRKKFRVKDVSNWATKNEMNLTHDQIRGRITYLVQNGYLRRYGDSKSIYVRDTEAATQTTAMMPVLSIEELKAQAAAYGLILCKEIIKIERV